MLVAIIGRFVHQNMRRRYLAEALLHQVSLIAEKYRYGAANKVVLQQSCITEK
jgi:hypothetical protein